MGIGGSLSLEEIRLRLDDILELWGEDDPVHPSQQAYSNLANNLLDQIKGKCSLSEDKSSAGRGVKRPREENPGRRPEWTAGSETSVSRSGRREESRGRRGGSGSGSGYGREFHRGGSTLGRGGRGGRGWAPQGGGKRSSW